MDQNFFVTPFASLGDQTVIPIPIDAGGAVTFQQGWGPDYERDQTTDPLAKPIGRATTNWLFFVLTQAVAALQKTGIPEWITPSNNNGVAFAYSKYAQVRYSATVPGVSFETYVSAVDNNTSVPGADGNWQPIASLTASAADVIAGTSTRTIVTPITLKSYPGNAANRFQFAAGVNPSDGVNLAQAQALRGTYQSSNGFSASITLTVAQIAGAANVYFGTFAAQTLTLPTRASVVAIAAYTGVSFTNISTVPVTLACNAADLFQLASGTTAASIVLQPGDDIELVTSGTANQWIAVSGSALRQFAPLLSAGMGGRGAQVIGQVRLGGASITAASTTMTWSAQELIVGTALGGTNYKLSGALVTSKTLNLATTGAGGMDTGTATANGYVGVYLIYNPTTNTSALLGQLETGILGSVYGGANMPAGYTASALIAVVPIGGTTGQFRGGYLRDRRYWHAGSNVTAFLTTTLTASYASISVAQAVPKTAFLAGGKCQVGGGVSAVYIGTIAGDASGTAFSEISFSGMLVMAGRWECAILATQTVFYTLGTTGGSGVGMSTYCSYYDI